jgi:subtilisin-like proprotein convertase family protein
MIMKPLQTLLAVFLLSVATTQAGLYASGILNTTILDGNPTGISSTLHVSGLGSVLSDVSVIINVSGGYNGDLRAYLSYGGVLVPLLSRVGSGSGDATQQAFGFSTAGFSNVRLDDAGSLNIHEVETPSASPTSYHPDGGNLSSFSGSNPNGDWTVFFADMAGGGGSSPSTLTSWSLEITAVPEPVNVALSIFGGVFAVVVVVRTSRVRKQLRRWQTAFVHWVDAV